MFRLKTVRQLKGDKDFDAWLYYVKLHLESKDLHELIDTSIPRPPETSPRYELWRQCSRKVRIWLAESITWDVAQEMEANPVKAEFADEYLQRLERVVFRQFFRIPGLLYFDPFDINKKDYRITEEYIRALRSRVALLKKVRAEPLPQDIMRHLIREFTDETEARRDWSVENYKKVTDGSAEFDEKDLHAACEHLLRLEAFDHARDTLLKRLKNEFPS